MTADEETRLFFAGQGAELLSQDMIGRGSL